MARRARGRFVRPAPRTSVWFTVAAGAFTVSSAQTLVASLSASALLLRPFTVVRTHLGIHLTSDQLAAGEFSQGALSIQVVTDSAIAAGIASIPTPLSQPEADYFVFKPVFADFTFLDSTGSWDSIGDGVVHWVDSKAMRKVGLDDDIAMVYEQRAAVGAIMAVEGRMLVKLH